ncbi:MAG: TetR/AcrR family transcriptional regulator [Deltaproteobacteria bacterium]|nr:TetR/AcrR family transcriptional regulator [Deltaproteobacteria bacterium]MBW2385991.1 TetR/AcrR family transcriptional regulator [Deltaproteobacteria bacterium]MBW2697034.1 TetR/AcrR family transcriptional regulator [Deltaproteobacteria bacterium]
MSDQMEERARRIVETAVELAEEGGFEAVRLRDVAAHAGVALGTLYRRFSSKEDLLVAALAAETRGLERRFAKSPPRGDEELERVMGFFALVGRGLLRRQNLARALLKAAASGEPGLAQKMASYHAHIEAMIVMSLRGEVVRANGELADPHADERERRVAETLSQLWFALLLGWSSGVHDQEAINTKMRSCAELVLCGAKGLR